MATSKRGESCVSRVGDGNKRNRICETNSYLIFLSSILQVTKAVNAMMDTRGVSASMSKAQLQSKKIGPLESSSLY